jgi:hypothetical protein
VAPPPRKNRRTRTFCIDKQPLNLADARGVGVEDIDCELFGGIGLLEGSGMNAFIQPPKTPSCRVKKSAHRNQEMQHPVGLSARAPAKDTKLIRDNCGGAVCTGLPIAAQNKQSS